MSKLFQEKKITIIIYVIILFFSGCVTTKASLAHLEANSGDDCTLDFESGINDIVVGETSFKEIESKLGKGLRSKQIFKIGELEKNLTPKVKHILTYPELGILFKTRAQAKLDPKRVAKVLEVSENSTCKTNSGIGIGSNIPELRNEINNLIWQPNIVIANGSVYTQVIRLPHNSKTTSLRFICEGRKSYSNFKVEMIKMWK